MGPTHLGRWSYACSKAIDEFLALAYHTDRALPVIIGRLFNTVGPRQLERYGMVVPTFARQAVLNSPITVFGDGRQQRCFCHVQDVVRAIADLMELGDLYGEVFNIGSDEEVTIRQLAECVRELAGSRSEIVTIPYDEAYGGGFEDMYRRVPDTTKIEQAIGWRPTRDLDETLSDVLASTRRAVAGERERRGGLSDRRQMLRTVIVERRVGPGDRRRIVAAPSEVSAALGV
jgi:UDP-glucose 4-epimerase